MRKTKSFSQAQRLYLGLNFSGVFTQPARWALGALADSLVASRGAVGACRTLDRRRRALRTKAAFRARRSVRVRGAVAAQEAGGTRLRVRPRVSGVQAKVAGVARAALGLQLGAFTVAELSRGTRRRSCGPLEAKMTFGARCGPQQFYRLLRGETCDLADTEVTGRALDLLSCLQAGQALLRTHEAGRARHASL